MRWGEALLGAFVQQLYPDASVALTPDLNAYRVSFLVDVKDLVARREKALRDIRDRMQPKFPRRRRLRWMKIHRRGRHCP